MKPTWAPDHVRQTLAGRLSCQASCLIIKETVAKLIRYIIEPVILWVEHPENWKLEPGVGPEDDRAANTNFYMVSVVHQFHCIVSLQIFLAFRNKEMRYRS